MIVSTDFIKSDRRRDDFLRACPELVIVDEAHTFAFGARPRPPAQRHELLTKLASDERPPPDPRHRDPAQRQGGRVPVAARAARPELRATSRTTSRARNEREADRRRLARHLVQRRRGDIRALPRRGHPVPRPRAGRRHLQALARVHGGCSTDALAYARETSARGGGRPAPPARALVVGARRCCARSPRARPPPPRRCAAAPPTPSRATGRGGRRDRPPHRARPGRRRGRRKPRRQLPAPAPSDDDDRGPQRTPWFCRARRATPQRSAGEHDAKLQAGDQARRRARRRTATTRSSSAASSRPPTTSREHLAQPRSATTSRSRPSPGTLAAAEREERVLAARRRHERGCSSRPTASARGSTSRSTSTPSSTTTSPGTRPATSSARAASTATASRSRRVRVLTYYGANTPIDGIVLDVLLRKHQPIRNSLGVSVPVPADSAAVIDAILEGLITRGRDGRGCVRAALARRRRHVQAVSDELELRMAERRRAREAHADDVRPGHDQGRRGPPRARSPPATRSARASTCAGSSPTRCARTGRPSARDPRGGLVANLEETPAGATRRGRPQRGRLQPRDRARRHRSRSTGPTRSSRRSPHTCSTPRSTRTRSARSPLAAPRSAPARSPAEPRLLWSGSAST